MVTELKLYYMDNKTELFLIIAKKIVPKQYVMTNNTFDSLVHDKMCSNMTCLQTNVFIPASWGVFKV